MIHCDTQFAGGNGLHFLEDEESVFFDVDLHDGAAGLWFYFRVKESESFVDFIIRNAQSLLEWPKFRNVYPVIGQDGVWRRTSQPVEVLREKNQICFTVECHGETRVAFCYPYTLDDLNGFRDRAAHNVSFHEEVLCESSMGYPVYLWTIGSGPLGVWLTARQHAGETPPSFVLEGLIEELLHPRHADILEIMTIRCCPMVDVDNVQRGAYGKYGPPCDPYMEWCDNSSLNTITRLRRFFQSCKEKPVLYLDMHSPEPCGSTYVNTWLESEVSPKYWRRIQSFCRYLSADSLHPLKLDMKQTRGHPEWFSGKIDQSSQGYFKNIHNCLSLTLEVSYQGLSNAFPAVPDDYRRFGDSLRSAITDYIRELYFKRNT